MLQRRDIEILKRVFAFRVMTYNQIQKIFFSRKDSSISRRRIRRLCEKGFLHPSFVSNGPVVEKAVTCSEKSWQSIVNGWDFEINSPLFKSESPNHDIRVADVSFRFERLKSFCSFLPENLLQSSSALADDPSYHDLVVLQSDGVLKLLGPDKRHYLYAVEVEISKKSCDRYREKLGSYYRAGGIDGVIYVCASNEILSSVARIDREVCTESDSIVYLALESSVLESKDKIYFQSSMDKRIGLF